MCWEASKDARSALQLKRQCMHCTAPHLCAGTPEHARRAQARGARVALGGERGRAMGAKA